MSGDIEIFVDGVNKTTLGDFLANNEFTAKEVLEITWCVEREHPYRGGGGAAPAFLVTPLAIPEFPRMIAAGYTIADARNDVGLAYERDAGGGRVIQITCGDDSVGGPPEVDHWIVALWSVEDTGGPEEMRAGLTLDKALEVEMAPEANDSGEPINRPERT